MFCADMKALNWKGSLKFPRNWLQSTYKTELVKAIHIYTTYFEYVFVEIFG
jgi:hypothetical protein